MTKRVYIYDSTLRDGAQTQGVNFTVVDKQDIARELDQLGVDYIEGGWPGANPTDDAFFRAVPKLDTAKMVAFGMTHKAETSAANDPGLNALINTGVKQVCIVGKSSAFHVQNVLGVSLKANLQMVSDSIAYIKKKKVEAFFDAEHFFDSYKANPEYALSVAKTAYDSGARWVILCDTNGGTLPHEIDKIVRDVAKIIPGDHLGIHCHNDTENAVANSLTAVQAGVRQVQGTMGGVGERCGNANLFSIIPNLMLKMGYETGVSKQGLKQLTRIANRLEERIHLNRARHLPYVGASAFAHKGGLHVSAVVKDPSSYEHINPDMVGNERIILISDQAGKSNIMSRLTSVGIKVDDKDPAVKRKIKALTDEIKERENQGYAYDVADASFEILARRFLESVPEYYHLKSFRVIDERRWNAKGELITLSEATTKIVLDDKEVMTVAEGNGPVNALNLSLKKALARKYKSLKNMRLRDYKVRIVTPEAGSGAVTRVLIETADKEGNRWCTVGVSTNIIDASYNALHDAIVYKLLHSK
ncbi:MAG: citramalate synthase [Proteobacteria bacterium]|nr:citramalate synthase [Pseudomonadota bacterium]